MKKYLNLFTAVMFAALSVSMISCSKDDKDDDKDSPSNTQSGKLSIDGSTYEFNYFFSTGVTTNMLDEGEWSCVMAESYTAKNTLTVMVYGWDLLSNGYTFTSDNKDDLPYITVTWAPNNYGTLGALSSGKVVVNDINSKTVTINFDNATFKGVNTSSSFTVNGTLKMPIKENYM